MTKPLVHYVGAVEIHITSDDKYYARVEATDHPKLGAAIVRTSQLISMDFQTGNFETLNTLYVPLRKKTAQEAWDEAVATAPW